jgi:hypothetical protein
MHQHTGSGGERARVHAQIETTLITQTFLISALPPKNMEKWLCPKLLIKDGAPIFHL